MTTLTDIVAATDLSAPSQHAGERAACLARMHDAQLTLVHVVARNALDTARLAGDSGDSAAAQTTADDARARLHALAAMLQQRHGARVVEHVETGMSVLEVVVRVADRLDAGLVVTGTRGGGPMRGVIVGSTAERIARFAKRPVLMVRQAVREPYRRVLVPVDFSPWGLDAVRLADLLAPEATLRLVHAVEAPEQRRKRVGRAADRKTDHDQVRADAQRGLAALAARTGLPPQRLQESICEGSSPWEVIAQQQREHDCDLIVMGRQGRHALQEVMLGSTTSKVLSECSADVLVSVRATAPDVTA